MTDHAMLIINDGISLYRLLAVRKMIELEARGIQFRGGSVTARMRRELGVRGKRAKVLAALNAEINRAKALVQPGDIQTVA